MIGMATRTRASPGRRLSRRQLRRLALGLIVGGYLLAGVSFLAWLALLGNPAFGPVLTVFLVGLGLAFFGASLLAGARVTEGSS